MLEQNESSFGEASAAVSADLMSNFEIVSPPDESVSALEFSPATLQENYIVTGSWDSSVRCWAVDQAGITVPKSVKNVGGPVWDVCWSGDGTKAFAASYDKQVRMWDLGSNQIVQAATHDGPVKTCHWIKGNNYTCLMTGSWDKTLKFWDARSPNPILTLNLPGRCYCADVDFPMAVVGIADRGVIVYSLENSPTEVVRQESLLKHQHFTISIFKDENKVPTGYALGSIEGRVAIQYADPGKVKDNFTFKSHYSGSASNPDIYAVNDIKFQQEYGTLATVGSDGTFKFWDKDRRIKLKTSQPLDQPITKCDFNANGQIFAYAVGYDWGKGYE